MCPGWVMSYLHRLATFARCPLLAQPTVSCVKLARCGFIYDGQSDHLVCERCGFMLSGWQETQHNHTVEHCCPSPTSIVAEADHLPLLKVCRDQHSSNIYAIYIKVLQRATRNGVLTLTETRDLTPHDHPGCTSSLVPTQPDSSAHPGATPSDDDFTSADTIATLKLSLAKRHESPTRYCPCCVWYWWWQFLGMSQIAAGY